MDNNNNKQNKMSILGILALVSAAVSLILAILGTTLTCACSARKTWKKFSLRFEHKMSLTWIISLFAIICAVAAVVLGIMALSQDRKNMMAMISLAVGVFSALYAFIPMVTICSYNCALDSQYEKALGVDLDDYGDLDDLFK